MKIPLVLLSLVVLFVSLPSVVFAQPPLRAVQSGETSQAAPKVEAVKKSWEGPVFGIGLGLGISRATFTNASASIDGPLVGILPVRVRLGYGLSDRAVLYAGVGREPGLNVPDVLGMMFRGARNRDYYGFFALGATRAIVGYRTFVFRGGSGMEVSPGLSVEGTGAVRILSIEGTSITGVSVSVDLTFNYHFY